jgi:hypothetical protein
MFFNANFPEGTYASTDRQFNVAITETGYRARTVTISASVDAPLYFLRLLRLEAATVRARGAASYPLTGSAPCSDQSPKLGFIAQWAGGAPTGDTTDVMNRQASSITNANEKAVPSSSGCRFGPPGSSSNLTKMRQDAALRVYIFTIGLGGTSSEPPDQEFMRRISNVPDSPVYDPAQPTGLYVFAPTPAQLGEAFYKVASEILRLTE